MINDIRNIRLIAVDIDNTIIPSGRMEISSRLRMDFHKAMENGIRILVNTGRHYTFLQPSLFDDLPMDFIGTINGACVNRRDGTVVEKHEMSKENMDTLTELCVQYGGGLGFKFVDHIVTYANHEKFVEGYVQKGTPWENAVIDGTKYRNYHEEHGYPLGTFIIGEEDIIKPFVTKMTDLQFAWSFRHGFDVFLKSVNKATSVECVLKEYGLTWENIIAFGDAGNDIAFIEKAGIGVAMGNAKDHVQDYADLIAPDCKEDGVACILEKLGIV